MWQRILAGFRAVGGGMGSKLLFVAGIIVIFALSVLIPRIRSVHAADSLNGNWMGVVSIARIVSDGTLHENVEQQGNAVIQVVLSPVWFSFLDRTDAKAVLIDASGQRHTFDIERLNDDWLLPIRGNTKELLASPPDGTISGSWNYSFPDFVLTFKKSLLHGSYELPARTSYKISGSLKRGDEATLNSLVKSIQKPN
ncbi:hypothetical protein [Granulicella sp. S156]|jgi:hypothetical protein|uniref:hypothetical protein n=1 Tax=Granulicella sp. S156 TaxID=1747224 RepID=UPI00131B56C6|nr:hypothetical protein [Granulicella sp. S156]